MSSLVYEIAGLTCVREKSGARFDLKVAEFSIQRGDTVVIRGASGCGKSTLLDILGMVLPPSAAECFNFHPDSGGCVQAASADEKTRAELRRSEIGYVLQHGALVPYLTVLENVELPLRLNGCLDTIAAMGMLERLNIGEQAWKIPQYLSGGQRQRVAIARALATEPPVLLADEPTAAVDELTASQIMRQLSQLSRDLGTTLIVVTHNPRLADQLPARHFSFLLSQMAANHIVSTCHETEPPVRH